MDRNKMVKGQKDFLIQERSFQLNSPISSSTTDFPTILSNFQDEIIEEFSNQKNEGSQAFFPKKSLHSQQNIVENCTNEHSRTSLRPRESEINNNDKRTNQESDLNSCSQIPLNNCDLSKLFEAPFPNQWNMLFFNENKEFKQEEQKMEQSNEIHQKDQNIFGMTENKIITSDNDDNDDGYEAVRKQILQLNLEENVKDSKNQSINKNQQYSSKKKLNLNSQEFYSFQKYKEAQPIQQNQPQINLTELQDNKPMIDPQLMPLSCSEFKKLYLQEKQLNTKPQFRQQYQQPNYYQQQQFNIDSPITPLTQFCPLTPPLPISNNTNSQIIVQTTHNPFILEISAKRHTGFLKYFDPIKQYGFIVIDDENREIFFHFQDVTHYLLTSEFLNSFREGRVIKLSFNVCLYRGKTSVRRKAVNLEPL